jgi:hypothetical protein
VACGLRRVLFVGEASIGVNSFHGGHADARRTLAAVFRLILALGNESVYSPYAFLERLCHLDEYTDFRRAKTEFRKFEFIKVLDDPRVAIEKPSGA